MFFSSKCRFSFLYTFSAAHVDERIEEFLRQFENRLEAVTEVELETRIQSTIKLKQMPDASLGEEVTRNWNEILSEQYIFDRLAQEVIIIYSNLIILITSHVCTTWNIVPLRWTVCVE